MCAGRDLDSAGGVRRGVGFLGRGSARSGYFAEASPKPMSAHVADALIVLSATVVQVSGLGKAPVEGRMVAERAMGVVMAVGFDRKCSRCWKLNLASSSMDVG